ncbi:branched-chain amino acid ABC transporter permease [Rhizobium sp. LjRoot30]|uniref:branched-chain amino acid ABC transporter permease n=1 Tax=Rhizobium sp. LjRoot30 TaxID=3342320 RepID=UPI003ECDFD99
MYLLQQLANAIPLAALYAALAFGYAIAFGVTKRADLTYGALFAFAGQIYVLFADIGWNRLWLVLPAALALGAACSLAFSGGVAFIVGRNVMAQVVRRSPNTVIVAGLGVLIFLMETARLASETRSLWLPPFLNRPVVFVSDGAYPVTLTVIQLLNCAAMLLIIASGAALLRFSFVGRIWRAVTDDPKAAELCGINAVRVFLLSYWVAAMIAAVSGILATSYYGNMDFGSGLMFGLKVLMVASIGGYTDPLRSAGGAALLGLVETIWSAFAPIVWRDLFVFSLLVFVLVVSRREKVIP